MRAPQSASFRELIERALQIRQQYAELEGARYGRSWQNDEIALGFVGDVGNANTSIGSPN